MDIIENYLETLSLEDADLFRLLSKFKKIEIFKKPQDRTTGLLKYKNISSDTAFLFKMSEESIQTFHTVGLNFNIDIYFFNSVGKLVSSYKNVKPGTKTISSKVLALYVVETLAK